jgi:hypothetical protein
MELGQKSDWAVRKIENGLGIYIFRIGLGIFGFEIKV